MVAVLNHALGPAEQLDGPARLIDGLREPLSSFLPSLAWADDPLSEVAFIGAEGSIAPEVHDWAGEYTNALYPKSYDTGTTWLPKWSWQRAEQVERAFNESIRTSTAKAYSDTREFVIQNPAGGEVELLAARDRVGALPAGDYGPIPGERTIGPWWWPCPTCGWPMRVLGDRVRCDIRDHEAIFSVGRVPAVRTDAPALTCLTSKRQPKPRARDAQQSVCVPESVWRFIVVPGLPELKLRDRLGAVDGVVVSMWPDKDTYDIHVELRSGEVFEVDVKDHARAATIVGDPPAAGWLVVPDGRKQQVAVLRERLPDKRVLTSSRFVSMVRSRATGSGEGA
jgi:hypothetical protein